MRSDVVSMLYLQMSGMVARYHTVPTVTTDTVGEHTFGVALLCVALSGDNPPRAALLLAALYHDLAELSTGDIPAPIKRQLDIRNRLQAVETGLLQEKLGVAAPELTPDEDRILQIADAADGLLHCCYERALGNQLITETYNKYLSYVVELHPKPKEWAVVEAIKSLWDKYHHA